MNELIKVLDQALKKMSPGLPLFLFSLMLWAAKVRPYWIDILAWASLFLSYTQIVDILKNNGKLNELESTYNYPKSLKCITYFTLFIFFIAWWVAFSVGLAKNLDLIGSKDFRYYVGFVSGLIWMILPSIILLIDTPRKFWWVGLMIAAIFTGLGINYMLRDNFWSGVILLIYTFLFIMFSVKMKMKYYPLNAYYNITYFV